MLVVHFDLKLGRSAVELPLKYFLETFGDVSGCFEVLPQHHSWIEVFTVVWPSFSERFSRWRSFHLTVEHSAVSCCSKTITNNHPLTSERCPYVLIFLLSVNRVEFYVFVELSPWKPFQANHSCAVWNVLWRTLNSACSPRPVESEMFPRALLRLT